MTTAQLPSTVEKIIGARTGDAVFVIAPDYRIAYWDSRAEFFTGIRAEEVIGKLCYEVVLGERESGEPFCSWGCSVMRMSQEGRPVASYDMQVRSSSGGRRWVNVSTLSLDDDDGTYIIHLMRDAQEKHQTVEMARNLIQLSKKNEPGAATLTACKDLPALTARQFEVLNHLAEGKSVKEIKAELHLSEATVRNHVRSVLQALGAHSQLEALARARELGIVLN
ncbi:MAG: LuxR C-terminal-related transcriptional regulator [Rubrobacteraceae bacterium]